MRMHSSSKRTVTPLGSGSGSRESGVVMREEEEELIGVDE
jgi:hypothetical protein